MYRLMVLAFILLAPTITWSGDRDSEFSKRIDTIRTEARDLARDAARAKVPHAQIATIYTDEKRKLKAIIQEFEGIRDRKMVSTEDLLSVGEVYESRFQFAAAESIATTVLERAPSNERATKLCLRSMANLGRLADVEEELLRLNGASEEDVPELVRFGHSVLMDLYEQRRDWSGVCRHLRPVMNSTIRRLRTDSAEFANLEKSVGTLRRCVSSGDCEGDVRTTVSEVVRLAREELQVVGSLPTNSEVMRSEASLYWAISSVLVCVQSDEACGCFGQWMSETARRFSTKPAPAAIVDSLGFVLRFVSAERQWCSTHYSVLDSHIERLEGSLPEVDAAGKYADTINRIIDRIRSQLTSEKER